VSEPHGGPEYFGSEVRHARLHAGLKQKDLATSTCYAPSYVGMVENGERLGSAEFARGCDEVFNTSGFFARLRERLSQRGHPEWFVPYVRLEATATSILDYSATLIMGMLQTPEYADALFRAVNPRDDVEVTKEKIQARMERHAVMVGENPPLLWVILNEACLWRVVGGPETLREQLGHLLEEAESPHITLQVLPFSTGAPPSTSSFTLLTFEDDPTVVYAETTLGGQVVDSPKDVANAVEKYDRLRADALSPEDSIALIPKAIEELSR
jgi:transcriptional regulator with XRE-family HTH domain